MNTHRLPERSAMRRKAFLERSQSQNNPGAPNQRRFAPTVEVNIPEIKIPQAAPVTVNVPDIVIPQAAPVTVNVPDIVIPQAAPVTVNVPDIVIPQAAPVTVNVPEIKVPPVVFNYDDKHLITLTNILKEIMESNRIKIDEISAAAQSSNKSADDATAHLKHILELTKEMQRPIATDGSDGDISLGGGEALRFLANIETKASVLGDLQIVKDSLIDSGELAKFKTSTQDLIVALIAAVNQIFNDIGKIHRDYIKQSTSQS